MIEDKAICGNNGEIILTRTVIGDDKKTAENNTSKAGYGNVFKKRSAQHIYTNNIRTSEIPQHTNNHVNNYVNNSTKDSKNDLNDCLLQCNVNKTNQSDEYKSECVCPYNGEPLHNSLSFLNPKNCSVVQYPWNFIYTLEETMNMQQKNRNFYNISFPWKTMNADTFNNNHLPSLPNNGVLNYIPQMVQNNFYPENIELCHDNRNVRPILNRNLSCT